MSDLRFKVGASLDGSFDVVFKSIVTSAKRARTQVSAELNAGAAAMQGPYRTSARAASEALESVGKTAKQQADAMVRDVARSARERVAAEKAAMREIEADLRRHNAETARATRQAANDNAKTSTFGRRVGYWGVRNLSAVTPTLNMGARVAGDIARGAGVDMNVGSLVGHSVEKESLATSLAIQGYKSWAKPGDAAGIRQNPNDLTAEANKAGNAVGMDPNEILKAMTRFVDLTGDLQTARGTILDLGKMSNATGSDLQNMASAAAAISVQLDASFGDDKQGKIKSMNSILRNLSAQGKEGAVEIKQYASQMSKVAAAAGAFGGNREEVFNLVGAIVQESRKRGGSTTATQAATSVAALARDLTKDSARIGAHGINVWDQSQGSDGKVHRFLASPEKIIEAAIVKMNGDEEKLRGVFKNSMSFRAVQGFALTYNLAEANKKGSGKQALEDEFKTLKSAVLSVDDIERANAQTLETGRAKAQLFQNQLQEIADTTAKELLPAMGQLAPQALAVSSALGTMATFAAKNPGEAVMIALGAAIAKASVEQTIRGGLEKVFSGAAGKSLGQGMAIMAASVVIYETGKTIIDSAVNDISKKQNEDIATGIGALNASVELDKANLSPEELAQKRAQASALKAQVAKEYEGLNEMTTGQSVAAHLQGLVDPGAEHQMRADVLRSHEQTLKFHMDALRKLEAAIDRNTARVNHTPVPQAPSGPNNVTPGHPGGR